ncbi:MAG: Mercuric resistance operon regulatory protein [Myxococcaceae bacterium]|nr:Mercuric resistance operon regulatory protein [Myxococcaceae bacterium]
MTIQLPLRKKLAVSSVHSGASDSRAQALDAMTDRVVGVRTVRVGDLAKRTGKTVRALHLYEEHGLLAPATRSSGGYRLYSRDAELRVRWIDKLQQMGFSLTDIKQIVQDIERSKNAPDAMQRVQDLFREKLDETREQLRRLGALEGELTASLSYLKTCDGCETPREDELLASCAACARHDCGHKPPELVLGFRVH